MVKLGSDAERAVGIWIRVSTEDQARGESPEHHEKRARAYAEAKGWNVIELYNLAGVSGKSVMGHPEAQRMLADVKRGHIQGLIFSKLARLARNTRELLDFADLFRASDADLVSLQESIDTSTPAGRLFYTMIAAMAQWEREEIADRVAVSIPIRAKLGKPMGGAAPFGYRRVDKKLVVDPVEGPVRRLVYELFAEHKRKRTVASILNNAGHRTRAGVPFTHLFIKRLIQDPTAKGAHRANYTRLDGKRVVLKDEKDWVVQASEPLVSEELWTRCNTILGDQRASRRPVAKRRTQLFGGVTYCECGGKMYVRSNNPKYVCETCKKKIPIVDLEAVFHEQLRQFSVSPDDLTAYLYQANEGLKSQEERLQSLVVERTQSSEAMERVYDLYMGRQLSADGFGSRYKPLEDRVKQLDNEIPRLQAEIDYVKIAFLSREEILRGAQTLYEKWPTLTSEEKRQVTEAVVEKITVSGGEISIEMCHLPSLHDDKMGSKPLSLAPAKRAFLASSTAM